MTWSDRIKLAWTTFKREALPLYTWTFIFIGIVVVFVVATVMGSLNQLHWTLLQASGEFLSPGMPVPGIPPSEGMPPFNGPFGSHNLGPFDPFNGAMGNFSSLLSSIGTIAGTLILIIIVVWLIGSAFYTGLFNLTAKSYHEKTTFKDFRFAGFLRFLSWQGFLLIIQLILLTIGLIGAVTLRSSQGALISFFIVYGLMIVGITIFALPWLSTSAIYLLAHPNDRFRNALSGSWRFFRKNTGALWGYIGTVILIEIAFQVLNRISPGIAGLATLVVSPFIAILAIVWVLSLEEDELNKNIVRSEIDTPPPYSTVPFPEAQANPANSPTPDPLRTTLPTPEHPLPEVPPLKSEEPKINLQKHNQPEPMNQLPEDNPNFCPSCGRANTGTAYCPQCGTKLH